MTEAAGTIPLARLLAMAFRNLVDNLHHRLVERGWDDVRPAFGFALLAARETSTTITELATLMGTTKQAASKLAATMIDAGYLAVGTASDDGRQRPLHLSSRGSALLADVEDIYRELESEWVEVIGASSMKTLRRSLHKAVVASHGGQLPAVRPTW